MHYELAIFFAGALFGPTVFDAISAAIAATGEHRFRVGAYRAYYRSKPRAERPWRLYWWWHVVRFWFVVFVKCFKNEMHGIRDELTTLEFKNGMTFRRRRFGYAELVK